MPKSFELALKRTARKLFGTTKSKRANAFVYGTMRKTGWTPKKMGGGSSGGHGGMGGM